MMPNPNAFDFVLRLPLAAWLRTAILAGFAMTCTANEPLTAFPGAQGWAAHTPGGRGGEILRVTNLAPEGPGSLLAALAAKAPRPVVF